VLWVSVMGKDWLAGEGRGGDKFLIFFICSIFLVNFSFHARNSNHIFSSLACCFALIPLDANPLVTKHKKG
jgi:hypothetical protein